MSEDSQNNLDRPSHLEYDNHYQKAYSQRDREMKSLAHEREYK